MATPTPTPVPEPPSGLRVVIPALGINLPIVEGTSADLGSAGMPPLNVAVHLPGMGWPGSGKRSFIYAHGQDGMFGPLLARGAVGETVNIVWPSGRVLSYTIRSYTRNWPVKDLSIITPVSGEELVLYTCTSWTYSDPKVVAIAN